MKEIGGGMLLYLGRTSSSSSSPPSLPSKLSSLADELTTLCNLPRPLSPSLCTLLGLSAADDMTEGTGRVGDDTAEEDCEVDVD